MRSAALGAIAVLASASAAHGATWTVTTRTDSQDGACTASTCSLRDAIAAAGPGDVVVLPASRPPYVLSLGQIQITAPITVQGTNDPAIDARSASRIFEITSAVGPSGTVTFDGLTLTHGAVSGQEGGAVLGDRGSGNEVFTDVLLSDNSVTVDGGADGFNGGGAISDRGADLTITNSTLRGNSVTVKNSPTGFNGGGAIWYCPANEATLSIARGNLEDNTSVTNDNRGAVNGGGAILNVCGTVDLNGSTLTGNRVTANGNSVHNGPGNDGGGAILNDGGPVTLSNSTVAKNTATVRNNSDGVNGGGAILDQAGPLSVDRSTIAGNTTIVGDKWGNDGGGGILNWAVGMTISSSTISGNTARFTRPAGSYSGGGGVEDDGQKPSVYTNTTITGNTTDVPKGYGNGGGGIDVNGQVQLTNVTLARNRTVNAAGGGIVVGPPGAHVAIKSTILADDRSGSGGANCGLYAGSVTSLGHNLLHGGICDSPGATDELYGAPRLGPLRDNQGPTRTLALLPGSAAIDAIPLSACTDQSATPLPITTDQRGHDRGDNGDGRCDIGAYENEALPTPATLAPPRITGELKVGATLTAIRGQWANGPTSYVHRWMRCDARGRRCRAISRGTGVHYTLRHADAGHRLRVQEVAANAHGTGVGTSRPTRPVAA